MCAMQHYRKGVVGKQRGGGARCIVLGNLVLCEYWYRIGGTSAHQSTNQGSVVKKVLKWVFLLVLAVFVALQFVRPNRENPPVDPSQAVHAVGQIDARTLQVLQRACFDCHSHETVWPWYSNVSPVSWLLVQDVEKGRRHLNFSIWGKYPPQRRITALREIREQVSEGLMPLPPYVLLHPDAKLDSAAVKLIIDWTTSQEAIISSWGDGGE